MALKEYQTALEKSKLYEVSLRGGVSGRGETLNASLWTDGTISVYGSDSATEPAALSDMVLGADETNVTGKLVFAGGTSSIPRYIAITSAGTPEIIATGLSITDLGAIS